MKFLVDAQLPRRLAHWLAAAGHDAIHTRDLPEGNCTVDKIINQISVRDERIVVTKDGYFVDTFLLKHMPYKLLLVATGNLSNKELERLFRDNLESIINAFEAYDFVEIDGISLICHL